MNRENKPLLMVLVLALLWSMAAISGVYAEQLGEISPAMKIVGTKVGENYLEVGLEVTAENMVSAGTVLQYDHTKLELITWDSWESPSAPIAIAPGQPGSYWTPSATIHTKGADHMAGKPALAYTTSGSAMTYLYLGTDSYTGQTMDQKRVATVRFQYLPGTSAGAIQSIGGAADVISFAPWDVAKYRIAGQASLTCTAENDAGMKTWVTGAPESDMTAYESLSCTWEVKTGDSIDQGGGAAGGTGDYAITFFDWDGRVIDAISAASSAAVTVTEFTAGLLKDQTSALNGKPGYAFDQWLFVKQTTGGLEIQQKPEEDVFTSNSSAIPATSSAIADFSNLPRLAAASGTKGVSVQAAYKAKLAPPDSAGIFDRDTLDGNLESNAAKYYTIKNPQYNRYGSANKSSGQYSVKFTVERQNENEGITYGVSRLRQPAIIVVMTPAGAGAQNILSLIELENTDRTEFEIVPTKAIASVNYKVADIYGLINWPGAAASSDPQASIDKAAFVKEGSLGYLAMQAYGVALGGAAGWESYVDVNTFHDAGCNEVNEFNIETAKSTLLAETENKNRKLENREVTEALKTYQKED